MKKGRRLHDSSIASLHLPQALHHCIHARVRYSSQKHDDGGAVILRQVVANRAKIPEPGETSAGAANLTNTMRAEAAKTNNRFIVTRNFRQLFDSNHKSFFDLPIRGGAADDFFIYDHVRWRTYIDCRTV